MCGLDQWHTCMVFLERFFIFGGFVTWEITADGSVSGIINPEFASLTYPELLEAMRAHAEKCIAAEGVTNHARQLQTAFDKALTKHCPVVTLDSETLTYHNKIIRLSFKTA